MPLVRSRAEIEFAYGGEGGVVRPVRLGTDGAMKNGVTMSSCAATPGLHHERWRHASGCGRWFNALRDTVTYRIHATWKVGEPMPDLKAGDKQ